MKTKHEIIDETASSYTIHTRAYARGMCFYEMNDGRCCAVGRCIDPKKADRQDLRSSVLTLLTEKVNLSRINIEDILLPEYQGHSIEFWRDLQTLHDNGIYWGEWGLSSAGKVYANHLKEKWA